MAISAETQRSRYETMKAVLLGAPRTERVRHLFLIQHVHYPGGNVAVLATMAWAPPIAPMTLYRDGIELPGNWPDGAYVKPPSDPWGLDLLGYDAFHGETFGAPSGEDAAEVTEGCSSVIAVRDGRMVGWVSGKPTEAALMVAETTPDGFDVGACTFMPPLKIAVPCVELAWVARDYRGRGIAAELVCALASAWRVDPSKVTYGLPFTRSGFALARSVAGPRFLASTQGIMTHMVSAREATTLASPDAVVKMPDLNAAQQSKLSEYLGSADKMFDFGEGRRYSPESPKRARRRDVRKQKPARGALSR